MKKLELSSNLEYEKLINNVIEDDIFNSLSFIEQRYIKILKRDINKNKLIPPKFYKEYIILCDKTSDVWEKAKKSNDYNLYKPYLNDVIEKSKELYGYMYPGMDVYDSMLNDYETGIKSNMIDKLFDDIKECLIPLLQNIKCNEIDSAKFSTKYSDTQLMEGATYLLEYIGFDFNRGALGIYPHGFTAKMNNNDVRIAFKNNDKLDDFVSTIIHEGGHGIFEQNIDESIFPYTNNCINYCCGLHESQSRLYENILGRNINFWKPIYNGIKKIFNLDVDVEEFVEKLNNVKPGFIRTEADELTYCFHIIIRYEIERDIFRGILSVDDVPRVWNEKMIKYLGIEPTNDSEGLLQDVHWSQGAFGYFPSYLIGNIYDGMLIEVLEKELGSIDKLLLSGNLKKITEWLNVNIHKNGGAYTGPEIIEKICGKEITSEPIIKYFKEKYYKN